MRLALALVALTYAAPTWADESGQCHGYSDLKERPDLAMARVVGAVSRVPFVRNAEGSNGCPSANDSCRDRAYLELLPFGLNRPE